MARSLARADVIVYFTPVTFGGVSSELKKALDRMIPNISPFFAKVEGETHHQKRYAQPASLIGLGVLPAPDREAEALFKTLVEDNATNLRSPRTAVAVLALDRPDTVQGDSPGPRRGGDAMTRRRPCCSSEAREGSRRARPAASAAELLERAREARIRNREAARS